MLNHLASDPVGTIFGLREPELLEETGTLGFEAFLRVAAHSSVETGRIDGSTGGIGDLARYECDSSPPAERSSTWSVRQTE